MRRAVLVVNPQARGGRAGRWRQPVLDALRATGWPVVEVLTDSPEHAVTVAREADPDDVLVALGGDGLLALLVEGALVSGAAVAPLPAGRGNDFARSLGLRGDPSEVALALPTARERRVDVGMVGERPFLGVASVGYDTVANTLANETRVVRGGAVYVWGGVRALLTAHAAPFTVTIDGERWRGRAWNVAVGNSGVYGGGLRICPEATVDDGALDVVVSREPMTRAGFVRHLLDLLRGRHVGRPGVWSARGREIHLTAPEPLVVFADGDPAGVLPVTITVRPGALRVLA